MKVLLIDDSEELGLLIKKGLRPHFVNQVFTVHNAERALGEMDFDVILIDVTLPDGNGFDLCAKLNNDPRFENIPKIMLTARAEESEKVYGFNCGADDYVTKPFGVLELKARIDRLTIRRRNLQEGSQNYGPFVFDLAFQKCFLLYDETQQDLGLTPTEFRVLLCLAKNQGQVMTRRDLEMAGWESKGTNIDPRGVDTHIAHLRKKLGDMKSVIVSVYGQGYSFSLAEDVKKAA